MKPRAILVCVDYWDILRITLPYNRKHFSEVMIVASIDEMRRTSPESNEWLSQHNVKLYLTDTFYKNGAVFNKWAALEEALDVFGRHGWLCIMDADVLWPKGVEMTINEKADQVLIDVPLDGGQQLFVVNKGQLCTPCRYMRPELTFAPEEVWKTYPIHRNTGEWAGYSQLFHAEDPVLLQHGTPWHETDWAHAGGADSFFQMLWKPVNKIRPPFDVLHLGPAGTNWAGRSSAYVDGSLPAESVVRSSYMQRMFRERRAKGSRPDRFSHEKCKPVQ